MTARLQAPGSRVAAVLALEAELRESPHRNAVFLVRPGELQPELPLRNHRGGVAAGDEDPAAQSAHVRSASNSAVVSSSSAITSQ